MPNERSQAGCSMSNSYCVSDIVMLKEINMAKKTTDRKLDLPQRLKNWRLRIERKMIKRKLGDHFTQEMGARVLGEKTATFINWESGRRGGGLKDTALKTILDTTARKNDEVILAQLAAWPETDRYRNVPATKAA